MAMLIRGSLSLALAAVLAGCISSGTMVTEGQAGQFQKGVTSRQQVIAKLGAPDNTTLMDDGTRVDAYVHTRAAANAASYIPVVGLLAGGANSTSNTATFTYDRAGVLKAISSGSSEADVGTGLLNQK